MSRMRGLWTSTSFCIIAGVGAVFFGVLAIYEIITGANGRLIETILLSVCCTCWFLYALSVRRSNKELIEHQQSLLDDTEKL